MGLADLNLSNSPTAITATGNEDNWDLPPPIRPSMGTRPSSSASIRTFESGAESPKVSVAAFKKGIRRPSESFPEGSKTAMDDDDDVPLGVLNKGFARAQSSLSLSDQNTSSEVPARKPLPLPLSPSIADQDKPRTSLQYTTVPRGNLSSQPPTRETSPRPSSNLPSPSLVQSQNGFALNRPTSTPGHQRNGGARGGSGGFVVMSAQSSRSIHSVSSQQGVPGTGGEGSPMSGMSRATSPMIEPEVEREEVIVSPVKTPNGAGGVGGSYFALKKSTGGVSEDMVKSSAMVERNTNVSPSRISSADKTQSSKATSVPLEPGLHDLVLPPRPSDTPDESYPARPRTPSGQVSPLNRPADFTRRISNFLAPAISTVSPKKNDDDGNEDGFDPALVIDSMAAFSDAPASPPKSGSSRPSLQSRLGQVAGGGRPVVPNIETDLSGRSSKGVKSPDSDQTPTPTIDSGRPGSSFNNSRPPVSGSSQKVDEGKKVRGRARGRTISGNGRKDAWSSSEDEDEDEYGEETVDGHRSGNKEEEIKVDEVASSSFRKPVGPRIPPTTTRAPISSSSPVIIPNIIPNPQSQSSMVKSSTIPAPNIDDGSSSEEETLATVRAKASRSSMALNKYPTGPSNSSQQPNQRGFRSPSSPNLTLSPPGSRTQPLSSPSPPTSTRGLPSPKLPSPSNISSSLNPAPAVSVRQPQKTLSPPPSSSRVSLPGSASSSSLSGTREPRRSPLSQSHSSVQLSQDASPPRPMVIPTSASLPQQHSAAVTASPASSQSGLTGDSSLQPVTPRESSVGAKAGERNMVSGSKEHVRNGSRDSSQPVNCHISVIIVIMDQ